MIRGLLLACALVLGGCAARPVVLDQANALPARVELRETPFFPQEAYQCGPAALATVLVQRGVETDPDALVGRVYLPGREGSLQVELVAAARDQGLLAYPLDGTLDALMAEVAAGNPVLVMQNLRLAAWPEWHFAVLVGYDREAQRFILRSGTEARHDMSFRTFLRTWHNAGRWAVVTVGPGQLPATAQPMPWLQAASDLEQTGKGGAAAQAYRTAAERWPAEGMPWFALANNRYAAGELPQAEQALRESLARQAGFAPAWSNLGQVLAERGCPAEARAARECALALSPEDARLRAPLPPARQAAAGRCAVLPVCPAVP